MNVLLVHGIWDNRRVFRQMTAALEEAGHTCFAPDLEPANGALGLADLARKLRAYADQRLPGDARFALVAHSMGSIVARIYLQEMAGAERASRFFTISGPHRGTAMAHLWPGRAARDMRFGSELLTRLNAGTAALEPLRPESFRTPCDLLVVPASSSKVPWARNHLVHCPLHHLMLRHPKVIEPIKSELTD